MARTLNFCINGKEFLVEPTKVDRKKLYGYTEIIALDEHDNECKLVSMDETGTLLIPKGGVGLGIVSPEMTWVDRKSLLAVDGAGNPAQLIPSSYSEQIEVIEKISPEEFMDYSIKSFYQLDNAGEEFLQEIKSGIYAFTYSYRESYEGSRAFLLESDGKAFMLVGTLSPFEMIGLHEVSVVDEEEVEEDPLDDDELDFGLF